MPLAAIIMLVMIASALLAPWIALAPDAADGYHTLCEAFLGALAGHRRTRRDVVPHYLRQQGHTHRRFRPLSSRSCGVPSTSPATSASTDAIIMRIMDAFYAFPPLPRIGSRRRA